MWSVEEASRFLASARGDDDPFYAAYVLVLVSGLRKGEALGLTWTSIDFTLPSSGRSTMISVRNSPPAAPATPALA